MTDTREQVSEKPGEERWGPTMAYSDSDFPEELSVVVHTDPSPLVASNPKGPASQAGLSVMVTNVNDDEAVRAHRILVQLKVSDTGIAEEGLLSETWSKRGTNPITRQRETRQPDLGEAGSGLYTFTYCGKNRGEEPFEPGETVSVFIHDIPVSAKEGATSVAVGVQVEEGDDPVWKFIPLGKFPTGYYLRELRADTNPVEYGKPVKLTWLEPPIEGVRYRLYANGEEVELNEDHPQPVEISELTADTTFELVPSWSTDVRDKQRLLIRVMDGDIAARNVSAKASLTVRDRTPLIRGDWLYFDCPGRMGTIQFSTHAPGPIVTNFVLCPGTSPTDTVYTRDSSGKIRETYDIAWNDKGWHQGYGFAYVHENGDFAVRRNFSPQPDFNLAFAYLL